jgi:hypothetical protein
MKFLSLSLLIVLSINSCKTNKVSTEETAPKKKVVAVNFIESGYSKATVIYDAEKSAVCQYLIQLDKGVLLEPLKFENKDLRKNNKTVWIKYHMQRRMSRCGNAQPVEITEILERK